MKISEALITKLSKVDQKSYMIALYPSKKSILDITKFCKDLDLKGEKILTPEEFHVTLRYWLQEDFNDVDKVKQELDDKVNFDRADSFGKPVKLDLLGDDKALVIKLESKYITELQKKVDSVLQGLGIPPSDFDTFIPHLSLVYGFEGDLPKDIPDFDIEFDRLKFVNNDDEVFWDFSGD